MNFPSYRHMLKLFNPRVAMGYHVPFAILAHILFLPKKVWLIYVYINYNALENPFAYWY